MDYWYLPAASSTGCVVRAHRVQRFQTLCSVESETTSALPLFLTKNSSTVDRCNFWITGEHSEEQVGGERQLQALVASQGRTSYAGSKRSYMWSLSSVMDPILWWHAEPQDWRETFSSEPSEVESKASCSFRWGGFSFSLLLSFILNLYRMRSWELGLPGQEKQ